MQKLTSVSIYNKYFNQENIYYTWYWQSNTRLDWNTPWSYLNCTICRVFQIVIEIPYILIQTAMYGLLTYSMIGFQWSVMKSVWYIFTMFFTFLYFTYYGMLAVAITLSYQVAAVVASAFYTILNLFSVFLIPRLVSSVNVIPVFYLFFLKFVPTSYISLQLFSYTTSFSLLVPFQRPQFDLLVKEPVFSY